MRAVVISEPGGPDVLQLAEVPDPEAEPGEAVVEIIKCSYFLNLILTKSSYR